jgi:hypothetical protein
MLPGTRTASLSMGNRTQTRAKATPGARFRVCQRRNRRDELTNIHRNRPSQLFEAQLEGGAAEEFN